MMIKLPFDHTDIPIPKNEAECFQIYGDPTDQVKFWKEHMVFLHIHNDFSVVKGVSSKMGFWCNKFCAPSLGFTFTAIRDRGLIPALESFDGCYNMRLQRGGTKLSVHSWGAAVDFNAKKYPLKYQGDVDAEFMKVVEIFKEFGWTWGGDFKRKDPMHFERTA